MVERLRHHGLLLVDGGYRVFKIKKLNKNLASSVGELVRQCHTKREVEAWIDGFEAKPLA